MKHLGTKQIETDRLILRQFKIEDAESMYKNWASDDEVTKYLTWPTHSSVEVTKQVLTEWIAGYEKDDSYQWAIEVKENQELIGSIGAVRLNDGAELAEVGYCIAKAFWHQGYTSEALQAVMDFFFDQVGMNRVECKHDVKNPHSGMVMTKCGLKKEGVHIEGDCNNTGICDVAIYGLTKKQRSQKTQSTAAAGTASTVAARTGKNVISDETIEYVGILAKLELSEDEKEQAKTDMGNMLDYIDKLNELDTEGVEPMSHVFTVSNVFREDVVENGNNSADMLKNAPAVKDGSYKVPKTVE